jgi:GMP synthase (glutamine-hydrolysing)
MVNNGRVAIIDLGGQYCHLIGRRLRDLGVESEIFPPAIAPLMVADYAGIILSGGPQSVYDPSALRIDREILKLDLPVLGICYGHQLLARMLGGDVARQAGEYGFAELVTNGGDDLFRATPAKQQVWMSHSDAVQALPPGFMTLASTDRCLHAAFANEAKRIFGVQFHPEVIHTEHGGRILDNFVRSVCGLSQRTKPGDRVAVLCERIRRIAESKSVFFLVSGGVDSTVAFVLCGMALPKDRVLGLYVDTGLMREGETDELRTDLAKFGLARRIKTWDASETFLAALEGTIDPEQKRQIIGRLFVEIQSTALRELAIDPDHWLLGQGTIYPDTIESGGATGRAALIKTHHNRCDEIRELIRQGKVIEPLAEFYKDEVREIGRELGLPAGLTGRWPFPGPGLAIRCICAASAGAASPLPADITASVERAGYKGALLPLQSVGVQGDARTYRMLAALQHGRGLIDYTALRGFSSSICNQNSTANRVVLLLSSGHELSEAHIAPATITRERVEILRRADFIARSEMERANLAGEVWQFPVILAPIAFRDGESIILRPVNSMDGMTANFASLPQDLLHRISDRIFDLGGVDAVFLDVTNKPPATIEWE